MRHPCRALAIFALAALFALGGGCGSDGGGGGGSDDVGDGGGTADTAGGDVAPDTAGGADGLADAVEDTGGGGDVLEDGGGGGDDVPDDAGGGQDLIDDVAPDVPPDTAEDTGDDVAGPAPSISATNQQPDPLDEVTVAAVRAIEDGWVVVHEDDGGAPGAILGHAAVAAGLHEDVVVPLDRDVVDGETLWAMLHVDAGTVGTFEPEDDPPVTVDGAPVVDDFVVTVDAVALYITADDQTADPADHVVVAEVLSDGPGWVVVHADDGGAPGDVLGQTSVSDGASTAIGVDLSRDATDGETLWAMLHVDAGAVGTFEPGVDAPAVLPNDAFVMDAFVVAVPGETVDPLVVAEDQTADPFDEVTVATVDSPADGWIVVHDDDGGAPGAILGYEAVLEGHNADVVVTLDRDAADGETLWAVLHRDAGNVGLWEPADDTPVTDGGALVMDSFVVAVDFVDAYVVADDQLADPANRVVVAEVLVGGNGWIVIHEDDGGAPGPIVGHQQVLDGLNQDIAVTLTRPAVDGETLHAMLHTDAGILGTFEFPGEDAAVLDRDGAPVVDDFVVTVPPPPEDPYIVVSDQEPAFADEVIVDEVFSVGRGLVVVHEDDGGAPGAALGWTPVNEGESLVVYVTLSRRATDGETLHAMLHEDTGVLGEFEPDLDVPATDGGGATVVQSFVVTVTAVDDPFVVAEDQTPFSPGEVTVTQVYALEAGWIVILDDDGGAPGSVLGYLDVFEGDNFDLVVFLDRDAADGETLWAALHVDAGESFAFEYPGPDVPVTDSGGQEVRESFTVTLQ